MICLKKAALSVAYALLLLSAAPAAAQDEHAIRRERLVREIENDVRQTAEWIGKSSLAGKVMEVMAKTPRHMFVPFELRDKAYLNRPLPIGYGQTISQPYIVALMTDLLNPRPDDVALEVGTGSGYQAAVLSRLVKQVYTVEIIGALGHEAAKRLEKLGYGAVTVKIGDGYYGWEEHAPYDVIIVTAAASHIPPPLVKQLKPGGRMIIPVGERFMPQSLTLVEKDEDGSVRTRQMLPVVFVPLTGEH